MTDTEQHIRRVRGLLNIVIWHLSERAQRHDESKLVEPEAAAFSGANPALKDLTYGSPEYKRQLDTSLGAALKHHYANNRHHPEHFENGVDDMTLIDLIEMFCDWKAATERHSNGSIENSLEVNEVRFVICQQLIKIFRNTYKELGWLSANKS